MTTAAPVGNPFSTLQNRNGAVLFAAELVAAKSYDEFMQSAETAATLPACLKDEAFQEAFVAYLIAKGAIRDNSPPPERDEFFRLIRGAANEFLNTEGAALAKAGTKQRVRYVVAFVILIVTLAIVGLDALIPWAIVFGVGAVLVSWLRSKAPKR